LNPCELPVPGYGGTRRGDLDNASIKARTVHAYGEDHSGIWMTWIIG